MLRMPDWKRKLLRSLRRRLRLFSNAQKPARELRVAKRFLRAVKIRYRVAEVIKGDDPDDVRFRDAHFQVKEIYDSGRHRTDEIKALIETVKKAQDRSELITPWHLTGISFSEVAKLCYGYAEKLVVKAKYGVREQAGMDLLFYFNWVNHSVDEPLDVPEKETGFRSLSIVGNEYSIVASASDTAPAFLKQRVGQVFARIER
jgi:hypothetical protein